CVRPDKARSRRASAGCSSVSSRRVMFPLHRIYLAWREEGDVGAFATMAPSVRSHRQHQCLRLKSAIGVSDVACLARYIATGQPTILAVGPQPCGHLPMAILPPIH